MDSEHVTIEVTNILDDEPYRWVHVNVSIESGGFSGKFHAHFLARELRLFRDELRVLYESLSGEATFDTIEQQLELSVTGNGRGGIAVRGKAADEIWNRLEFSIGLDQTYLPRSLNQLEEICRACSEMQ